MCVHAKLHGKLIREQQKKPQISILKILIIQQNNVTTHYFILFTSDETKNRNILFFELQRQILIWQHDFQTCFMIFILIHFLTEN